RSARHRCPGKAAKRKLAAEEMGQDGTIINLGDFVAVLLAGVLESKGQPEGLTRMNDLGIEPGVNILKPGVAQPVAKREQWITAKKTVSAVGHGVIRKTGQVGGGLVKGDGETASGIIIAKQGFGHSSTTLLSRVPGLENGGKVFSLPWHGDRA